MSENTLEAIKYIH